MLPNLIILGAMKCGTSSLHLYLNKITDVFMSEIKELDFFKTEEDFLKGIEWYSSYFPEKYKILGEASPNYTKRHFFPGVPERIASIIPDVKLIYIIRDPIKRSISHYLHNLSHGRERRNIQEALSIKDKFNNYLLTSLYYFQLEPYLNFFNRNQLFIVTAENLNNYRLETINSILDFLNIKEDTSDKMFIQKAHETKNKIQYTTFGRLTQKFVPKTFMNDFMPFKRYLKRFFLTKPLKQVSLDPDFEKSLIDFFYDDINKLQNIVPISSYTSPYFSIRKAPI